MFSYVSLKDEAFLLKQIFSGIILVQKGNGEIFGKIIYFSGDAFVPLKIGSNNVTGCDLKWMAFTVLYWPV